MNRWPVLLVMIVSSQAAFARETCHDSEVIAAMSVPYYIESWSMLHLAFQNYGRCDDGAPAEAFSENVARLLVENWDVLDLLAVEVNKNPEFEVFVLRHIDASTPRERLESILSHATADCAPGNALLCKRIAEQTTLALHPH